MSIKLMDMVWDYYPGGGAELLTALSFADHAGDDGRGVRPSIPYTAKKTRQSERTVSRILAKMRESKWLLVVRRGNGRGFASEYRINPLWITNPDKLACEVETGSERVTLAVANPDKRGMKRVTPVATQPSRTIKEPVDPQNSFENPSACFFSNGLNWPSAFDKNDLAQANRILSPLSMHQRQELLDVIAGIAQRVGVRRPLGLLKTLIASQGSGAGDHVVSFVERRAEVLASMNLESVGEKFAVTATPPSEEVKKASLERLAALRASFVGERSSKQAGNGSAMEERSKRQAQTR